MDLIAESKRNVLENLNPLLFLPVYPHSSAPCHNLHKNVCNGIEDYGTDFFTQLSTALSYEFTSPIPINNPPDITKQVINMMDPALICVKEKQFWEKHKAHFLKYCTQKSTENIDDIELQPGEKYSTPFNVALLAHHLSKDPDMFLTNNYNVYYTGGNLSSISIAAEKYFVFPKREGTNEFLSISKIPQGDKYLPEAEMELSTSLDSPIFQIEAYESFLISRKKNSIHIYSICEKDDGTLNIEEEQKINNDVPYYSVALHKGMFCTTTADRHFDIVDINERRSILNGIIESEESPSDNWSSTQFFDDNTLCIIDRSCVHFVDLRCKPNFRESWSFSGPTEMCEEAFNWARGSGDVLYVTTSHQLLCLDRRAAGFSQRWTHGITHSPALISVHQSRAGSDKIFIGSQISDSVVFIGNEVCDDRNLSTSQPYLLPNLSDTFHMARYSGSCLGNAVASRFSMSLTGLCAIEDESGINLFRLTSTGDLFRQSLKNSYKSKDMELTDVDFERLDQWEDDCEQSFSKLRRECTIADIRDDKHIINCLRSSKEYIEPSEEIDFSEVPWGISKKELLGYCDYLAPKILEEWGLEDIEEWAPGLNPLSESELSSSDEEEDITQKVSKWLEKYKEEEAETDYYYIPESDSSQENEAVILIEPDEPEDASNVSDTHQPPPMEHLNATRVVPDEGITPTGTLKSAGF